MCEPTKKSRLYKKGQIRLDSSDEVGIGVDHGIAGVICNIERGSELLLDAKRSSEGYLGDL